MQACGVERFGDYHASKYTSLLSFQDNLQRGNAEAEEPSTLTTAAVSHTGPGLSLAPSNQHTPGADVTDAFPTSHAGDSIASTLLGHDLNLGSMKHRFLELCVNTSSLNIVLGELRLSLPQGAAESTVSTDAELFQLIHKRYFRIRQSRRFAFLYQPVNIQFIRFSVYAGGRVGIYEAPMALPPEREVKDGNYHYYERPLDPLPPIDHRTFLHLFWNYKDHLHSQSSLFLDRLPKKLNTSMLMQGPSDQLNLGWGVHIIEGPNKKLISLCMFAIVAASL